MRKSEEDQGTVLLRYGKAILLGGVAAFLTCVLFLLIAAFGVSKGFIGAELKYQLTVVSCVLGGFVGGMFAVRQCHARGVFVGIAVGGVLFLLQLTLGLLLYRQDISLESGGVGLLCGAICGGAAAGILGGGGRRNTKIKKRRRG